ncbi:MAG: hypothetical protein ACYTFQ_32330, partial [Planctomycetota bacterium]
MLCGNDTEESESGEIIREVDWEGPDQGPHRILTFSDTPDNIIGVSPAMNVRRLADLANSLYRKQVNQAKRQRDLPIFEPQSADDVKNIQNAEDGRWTKVSSKDGVDILKMGGVDAGNQAFSETVLGMFDRMAGNLPAMAGLGTQADTLGQDQIIQQQASKRQAKMMQRVAEFTTDVIRDVGWLLWNDSMAEIQTEYEVPGTGLTTTSRWTPDHREGKF